MAGFRRAQFWNSCERWMGASPGQQSCGDAGLDLIRGVKTAVLLETMNALRWGIMGGAGIARKNWEAIRLSGSGVVTAVGSRDLGRAQAFVDQCQLEAPFASKPAAVEGYEALLARPDVDAVYIPLPTGIRAEWVERAAAAGKHVMCEKPCAGSAVALRSMLEACRKAGVQFMDGTMFQHSSRLDAVRRVLDDAERFGELRRVSSAFSFLADDGFARENIRGDAGLEPMGCLGDLGWYNTRISLWALGWKRPVRVSARCHRWMRRGGGVPVPAEVTVELEFEGGVTAGFYCSFAAADQQWVQFSGTRGGLRLDDFVLPFDGRPLEFETRQSEFVVKGCDFRMRSAARSEVIQEAPTRDAGAQESRMFRAFAECVAGGAGDAFWPRIALETQEVLDACMQAIVATGLSPSGSRED